MIKIFSLKKKQKNMQKLRMCLLPLSELHPYLSNTSNRPNSDWADNQSNGVAPGGPIRLKGWPVPLLATPQTRPCC